MSKMAFYSKISFTHLLGKLYKDGVEIKDGCELTINMRNEYPRFNIVLTQDESVDYFDRVKTIQMGSQILVEIVEQLKEKIKGNETYDISILYPNFKDNKPDEKIEIARVSFESTIDFIVMIITFDTYKCVFELKPDNSYYDVYDKASKINPTKRINDRFAIVYANNLAKIATEYPIIFHAIHANEVKNK